MLQTQAELMNNILHWGLTALLTVSSLIICGTGGTEMHLFLFHPFLLPFIFPPFCLYVQSFLNYFSLLFTFSINPIVSCLSKGMCFLTTHSNTGSLWNKLNDFKCFVLFYLSKSMRSFFLDLQCILTQPIIHPTK